MDTIGFLRKKEDKPLEYIRDFCYKKYIKTAIEKTESNDKRIIFMSNRNRSDFTNPMSNECNGLIVNYNSSTRHYYALVIPVQNFNSSKLNLNTINSLYKKNSYNIYKINDGTIVNLYYYKNKWVISTSKGYDVTNLILYHNKTYKTILDEVLSDYPEFSYDKLDINKSYTLSFKYYDYHPFIINKKNTNSIIFIQAVDMLEFNVNSKLLISYNDNIGLPFQEIIKETYSNINELYSKAEKAFNKYCHYIKNVHPIIINNIQYIYNNITINSSIIDYSYEPDYGYILRSNNFNQTKEYSNILIESSLMVNIRKLIYNNYKINRDLNINEFYNITEYIEPINMIKLKMFLTINNYNKFKILFPQYINDLNRFKFIINEIIPKYMINNKNIFDNNIINVHSILNDENVIKTDTSDIYDVSDINKLNKLVLLLYIDTKKLNINIHVPEAKNIIYDIILNEKYINIYYRYFYL